LAERHKVQEQIHAASFSVPEPRADGFRNCLGKNALKSPAGELLIDKARQPGLSAPEMTVLFGGLRVNYGGTDYEVFTAQSVPLSNDFFSYLEDMSAEWKPAKDEDLCEGIGHKTGKHRRTGTALTLRLATTPSSVRSRKMTRSPAPRRCSCTASSPPGTR
jgi:catalase-peroxidase